ncbi:HU family DNA-binding protein [Caulobacter sp. RHG1]|uniref:HU family DNA-binding protein n=1 Tax=Caulobacter sp. (strain RHG1) TaxID=2545762 RepID=UPI001554BAAE|nr:HU family DNA-binding protein [Caulobacter sp. RHG1]NQE62749.1 Integration host factor alpha subunit [Caulobacter sp. RHG1]
MNVSDLVDAAVAADDKLTKTQAKAIIDGVFKSIADASVKGDEVSIPGFGKFKVQAKPARTGRNPATGATIEIAASKKVAFTPAKQLKDAVNG